MVLGQITMRRLLSVGPRSIASAAINPTVLVGVLTLIVPFNLTFFRIESPGFPVMDRQFLLSLATLTVVVRFNGVTLGSE